MQLSLEMLIKQLSPELQKEVEDFVQFLLQKKQTKKVGKKLRQDWAGALQKYRNQYTSLELQKSVGMARRLMMYLIDTNVWLERLLNQESSEETRRFLDTDFDRTKRKKNTCPNFRMNF